MLAIFRATTTATTKTHSRAKDTSGRTDVADGVGKYKKQKGKLSGIITRS